MPDFVILEGNALEQLKRIEAATADCCVTSPPYWRKRDYGHPDQLGQEPDPNTFVENLAAVFVEVKRVLKPTGTLWLNIDDTYLGGQLVGVPWRLMFKLQYEQGWQLRSDIIWAKPSCTPEPVKNRPTHTYEHLFLLSVNKSYYYDYDAVLEPHTNPWAIDCIKKAQESGATRPTDINLFNKAERQAKGQSGMSRAEFGAMMNPNGKNRRDVWTIKAHREKGSKHLAPWPEELVELCVKAGSPAGGVVLDPFSGSGTTGIVAVRLGREYIGCELVPASARMSEERISSALPKS